MIVKFPKKILLAGEQLKLIFPKNRPWYDAEGNFEKGEIIIPEKGFSGRDMFKLGIFIHEVMEMAINARGHCYEASGGKKLFILSHDQYRNIIDDVAMAFKDVEIIQEKNDEK